MGNGKLRNDIRTLEKIYEVVKSQFDYVLNLDSSHSQRAATVFSFSGAILAIIFTLYPRGRPFMPFFGIGACFIGASLVLSFFAIISWSMMGLPNPEVLAQKYIDRDYNYTVRQVISFLIFSFKYNNRKVSLRGLIVDSALICVVIGVCFLALSVLAN